jgi:hypothetical protein
MYRLVGSAPKGAGNRWLCACKSSGASKQRLELLQPRMRQPNCPLNLVTGNFYLSFLGKYMNCCSKCTVSSLYQAVLGVCQLEHRGGHLNH